MLTLSSPRDNGRAAMSVRAVAEFESFAQETTWRRLQYTSVLFTGVFAVAYVVWIFTNGGDPKRAAGGFYLPVQGGFSLLCALVLRFVPWAKAHAVLTAGLANAVVAWAGGKLLGTIGGLDGPFFYSIYTLPPLTLALPVAAIPRLSLTMAILGAFMVGYFGPNPHYLSHPFIHIPMMYVTSITVVCMVLGHWIHNLLRDRFLFAARIEDQKEQLAQHNAALTEEVVEKAGDVEVLSERIKRVRTDERSDLARALHDDLGQLIVGARMELGNLEMLLEKDQPGKRGELRYLQEIVDSLSHSTRRIVGGLREELQGPPLEESIETLLAPLRKRAPIEIASHVNVSETPSPRVREVVCRTVQEGLTNVLKHAGASTVAVEVVSEGADRVRVAGKDDGQGFDVDSVRTGWGLLGIRERAEAVGGIVDVQSGEGGTEVTVSLPLFPILGPSPSSPPPSPH